MTKTFKIVPENNNIDILIEALTKAKEDIKDVFCAVRFTNGGLLIIDQDVPFETLCTISKRLDLIIDYRQQDEEAELAEYEEED